jgi:hypothetical protein
MDAANGCGPRHSGDQRSPNRLDRGCARRDRNRASTGIAKQRSRPLLQRRHVVAARASAVQGSWRYSHDVAIVARSADPGRSGRRIGAANYGAWPRTRLMRIMRARPSACQTLTGEQLPQA